MSITAFATAAASKKALEKVAEDIYASAKAHAQHEVAKWRFRSKTDSVYSKVRDIRYVKTIWQFEKQVDISSFYCPTRILYKNKRLEIGDIDDFPVHGHLLIIGTIGQGKSIFFRYLASRELQRGRCLPLFVELRRIQPGEQLLDHLAKEMTALGIRTERNIIEFLLEQGKLCLFLDAFDEVLETEQANMVTQIETLCRRFDKSRVFVSARPNTALEGSSPFHVIKVARLAGNEYQAVVRRMSHDGATADAIIHGVEAQPHVKTLLDTPLIVALLVIRYKADQTIPENTAAFYENLFSLMMQRHDKLKAGYVRPRKSGLSDGDLESVFSAFCYMSRKDNASSFKSPDLRKRISAAAHALGTKADADSIIRDIASITCLLLDDGGEYKFIHKSVQEFHAACFIRDQDDEHAKLFYEAMPQLWLRWFQELRFLAVIDKHRFNRYFHIPNLCLSLGIRTLGEAKQWNPSPSAAQAIFGGIGIQVVRTKSAGIKFASARLLNLVQISHNWLLMHGIIAMFGESLCSVVSGNEVIVRDIAKNIDQSTDILEIDVSALLKDPDRAAIVNRAATKPLLALCHDLVDCWEKLEYRTSRKDLFEF